MYCVNTNAVWYMVCGECKDILSRIVKYYFARARIGINKFKLPINEFVFDKFKAAVYSLDRDDIIYKIMMLSQITHNDVRFEIIRLMVAVSCLPFKQSANYKEIKTYLGNFLIPSECS